MSSSVITEALRRMVYETTHLSPCKPNGDHDCTIKAGTLAYARAALACTPTPSGSYDTGWSDGYAEGFAKKLAGASEPFAIADAGLPERILKAAALVQDKHKAMFKDDLPGAIGLVCSIGRILSEDQR